MIYKFAVMRKGGGASFHRDHIQATREQSKQLSRAIVSAYDVVTVYKDHFICLGGLGEFVVIKPDNTIKYYTPEVSSIDSVKSDIKSWVK
jgi:hypothetical protein